jgi:GH15 family glucan-1,4-alpha-glucosidase
VYALRRIGFAEEAGAFLGWVLDTFEHGSAPKIMYDLDGGPAPDDVVDGELEGYRRSAPVRWGNGAADQRQHDVYGEVLDCAYQWVRGGGGLDEHLWGRLAALADLAVDAWRLPDQGIWEVRSERRVFTYSAGLCQVALDRAARLAEHLDLPGPVSKWRRAAAELRETVLEGSWDGDGQTLSEHLDGGGSLDASLPALPLRRVVAAEHPRMVATTAAVAERLLAGGGLLYRYLHDDSPDGIAGDEGAFVLCSFWLVENLARQGRFDQASEIYASLCARASTLGRHRPRLETGRGSDQRDLDPRRRQRTQRRHRLESSDATSDYEHARRHVQTPSASVAGSRVNAISALRTCRGGPSRTRSRRAPAASEGPPRSSSCPAEAHPPGS